MEEKLIQLDREICKKPRDNPFLSYKKNWRKKSGVEKTVLIVMFVVFLLYGFSLIYPIVWGLLNSFKTSNEFLEDPFSLPKIWTFENYITVFKGVEGGGSISSGIWNSIWMSTASTVIGLIASSITAYVVSKYRFKGSKIVYTVAIFIQIIPLVGSVAGMYKLVHTTLEIANEPFLIWPMWFGGFGFSFLMLYSAFKSVPWSFAESAFIDGAGHFRTFVQIMLPAVKPILASLFVVNFIGAWNDYTFCYLYMSEYKTLAYLVYDASTGSAALNYPAFFATVIISIIPTLLLFVFFQKLIMENTTTGGLKG